MLCIVLFCYQVQIYGIFTPFSLFILLYFAVWHEIQQNQGDMTTIYEAVFNVKAFFSAFEIRFVLGCFFLKNNPRGCKQQPRGFIVSVRYGV